MANTKHQCEKEVRDSGLWSRYHQCHKSGKNYEDGKWWCQVHTPSVMKSKADARSAKWNKEYKERGLARERLIDDCITSKAFRMALDKVDSTAQKIMLECLDEIKDEVQNDNDN